MSILIETGQEQRSPLIYAPSGAFCTRTKASCDEQYDKQCSSKRMSHFTKACISEDCCRTAEWTDSKGATLQVLSM